METPLVGPLVAPLDTGDLWAFGYARLGEADTDPAALIRAALGLDVAVAIISRDEWTSHSLIATHCCGGRALLAGGACHLHPPQGGHGMNRGIADALDLGWKLGAVLNGWGGPALLDSYEIERRQVHRRVIHESLANLAHSSRSLGVDGIERDGLN